MFSLPDVDLGFACSQTKVYVKRNGIAGPLKEVKLPPNSKLSDLYEKSCKVLDLEYVQRAYFSNGVECTDIDHIEEDEIIHISCGEPFKVVEGGECKAGYNQVVGNFILHEKIGQGGFGSVMKGVHSETGEAAAVKFVPKKSFRQFSDLQRVFQEIQALRNLRHPNIIRILDVADNPDSICFIMEYAAGGELRGYVEKHKSLSEEESRSFFKQIVRAVHYIHSKKIIHRDLKLENILLDKENRCKIVDFGLSDYVAGAKKDGVVTDAGTEAYLAPEVYNGFSKGSDPFKIDSWALGVILFAMTHGKLPFSRPDVETCAMLDKDGLTFGEDITRSYARLTKAMLTPCPEKRASVDAIAVDPWVTMHRFAMHEERESVVSNELEHVMSAAGSEDSGTPSPTRRLSRSFTQPEAGAIETPAAAAVARSTAANAAAVSSSPPMRPADRPGILHHTGEHRGEVRASPRETRNSAERESRGDMEVPERKFKHSASPRCPGRRDVREDREKKDTVLPSLPAGRGAAGGAAPHFSRGSGGQHAQPNSFPVGRVGQTASPCSRSPDLRA